MKTLKILTEKDFNKMKHESNLVYLLEANGATEKDCKEADNKLKERRYLSGRYVYVEKDISYEELVLLNVLFRIPRKIPKELDNIIRPLRLRGLTNASVYTKNNEKRETITKKGVDLLSEICENIGKTTLKEFKEDVAYLNSKMNNRNQLQ